MKTDKFTKDQFKEMAKLIPKHIEKEYDITDPIGLVILGILSTALEDQNYPLILDCIRTLNIDLMCIT